MHLFLLFSASFGESMLQSIGQVCDVCAKGVGRCNWAIAALSIDSFDYFPTVFFLCA